MTWIQTFTGKSFRLVEPSPDDVDVRDIVQGLSHMPRYAGQTIIIYPVLVHSILVALLCLWYFASLKLGGRWRRLCLCWPTLWIPLLTPEQKAYVRLCLWHDASEAYLMDLPNPVKRMFPSYKALENRVDAVIAIAMDLPPGSMFMSPWGSICLKKAFDNAALFAEREHPDLFAAKPLPGWGRSIQRAPALEGAAAEVLDEIVHLCEDPKMAREAALALDEMLR